MRRIYPAGRTRLRGEIVAEMRFSGDSPTLRVRSDTGEEVIWCGPDLPTKQVGAELDADGYWDADHRGTVFRVEVLRSFSRPCEVRAAEKYLVANIPGLGPKRSSRLVRVLGSRVLEQLIENPEVARSVFSGGTGEAVTLALKKWAEEQKLDTAARLLATRLTEAGVNYGIVRRILRFFNSTDAAAVVTLRHPYRLIEVPRIGWETADRIAQRLGVAADDPERLLAACQVSLRQAADRGSSGLDRERLLRQAARLVGIAPHEPSLLSAQARLLDEGHAVEVDGLLCVPELAAEEAQIADRIAGVLATSEGVDERTLARIGAELDQSTLSDAQKCAVVMALTHGTAVITGRPGAGKTTTLKTLVSCAEAIGWRVQIVAPTGKAASRASAVTGVPASTVHRLLCKEPMDAPAPLRADLVIVDEASMCDATVAAWLLRAVDTRQTTRVVWCGDADQLPSVGHGQVLSDLIESGLIPTARLTEVFRQGADSAIIKNAHRLLDGEDVELTTAPGWRFVPTKGPLSEAPSWVMDEVRSLLAAGWSREDVQVLSPMRRGELGVEHLNRILQALLNPDGSEGPWIGGGIRARVGDRVVATRNVYDLQAPIYNGEQGIVVEADPRGWMRVNLEDREVTIAGIYCLMMRHAWAVTVHRSQGSEYPAVVLAYDHRTHAPMLDRRLLYTAITRAKQHCSLVGTEQAVRTSQQGAVSFSRQTTLAYQLLSLLPHVAVGRTAAPITLPGAEAPKGGERERESRQPTEGVTGGS